MRSYHLQIPSQPIISQSDLTTLYDVLDTILSDIYLDTMYNRDALEVLTDVAASHQILDQLQDTHKPEQTKNYSSVLLGMTDTEWKNLIHCQLSSRVSQSQSIKDLLIRHVIQRIDSLHAEVEPLIRLKSTSAPTLSAELTTLEAQIQTTFREVIQIFQEIMNTCTKWMTRIKTKEAYMDTLCEYQSLVLRNMFLKLRAISLELGSILCSGSLASFFQETECELASSVSEKEIELARRRKCVQGWLDRGADVHSIAQQYATTLQQLSDIDCDLAKLSIHSDIS